MARKYIKRMEDFKENSLQNEITDKIEIIRPMRNILIMI
jgi:hypothetical protein